MDDDEFRPRLGKIGSRGSRKGRRYTHQLLAAINRAGGRAGWKSTFTGQRLGRGGTVAAMLGGRDRFATYRRRRVVVKARIVKLTGKGMGGARAHLRYVQRDGVTRDGDHGELYGAHRDRENGKGFLDRAAGDRHQFRFIVAPEDGIEYDDLKPLTRRLMAQMEEDLGTRLDWVAVDHFNTGHPHSHIIVRGKDDRGRDLVIARDFIASGLRERAADLVSLDLGPRTDRDIEEYLRREMGLDRLTGLDRQLLRMADGEGLVAPRSRDAFRQTLLTGRLKRLARLDLAEEVHPGAWRLDRAMEETLRRLGERGDIIKTMQREMAGRDIDRSPGDYTIHDPSVSDTKPVVGRVVARGLSDEHQNRHYIIVDGLDGRTHYVDIGKGDATEQTPENAIVRVTPKILVPRPVDRTVAEIAAANQGRYGIDLHLRHDPQASESYARTHTRRLEAIRRSTGAVTREPDGTWTIPPDHLDRVVEHERHLARTAPVRIEILSRLSLDRLVDADGATWLDRELLSGTPEATRDSGFGRDVREAMTRRRQWLVGQGLAQEDRARVAYRANLLVALRRRELARVAGQLSKDLGLAYVKTHPGERVEGRLRCSVDLVSGRFAVIEKSRDFTLVPWRPVLDRHIGQAVSGNMRGDGDISWTIGRQRGMGVS